MIYERHGDYEVMEMAEFGDCGVWEYPGAMDEVDPIIILPTIEAARIWVSKQLVPATSTPTDAGADALAAANARIAALEAALEPFIHEWMIYQEYASEQFNGRADVGNYMMNYRDLDMLMDKCERAARVLKTANPETGGGM